MRKLFLVPCVLLCASAFADVHYTLATDVVSKTVRVTVTPDATADEIAFRIPSWCPGYYVILGYQEKISQVKATDSTGSELAITHTDPRQWVVKNPGHSKVTLSYSVLGDDPGLGFFAVSVKPHTAYVNGAAAFMYVEDHKDEPTTLKIGNPEGWETATPMESREGRFVARDYDEFIDHPIQVGKFLRKTFVSNNIPFEVVFVSPSEKFNVNADAETKRIAQLVEPTIKMYGGAPFTRYLFLFHLQVGNFSGGLEHQASNVIAFPTATADIDDLISHEFVHAWNVKNIRPKVLGPFDYTKQVRTHNLWFAEGVTDYYAKMDTYRSGLRDEGWLLGQFSDQISSLQNGSTRKEKTLEDASMAAWEGGSEGIGDLSYYNKGLVAGLIFDAAIRQATNGRKTLDDVMRLLYKKHRLPNPGYEEDGILRAIDEVAGTDLTKLYRVMVQSTEEMPYEILNGLGLRLVAPGEELYSVDFTTSENKVNAVSRDAQRQGLKVGDKVLSINGEPWTDESEASSLSPKNFAAEIERGGAKMKLTLTPVAETNQVFRLERDPFAKPHQRILLDGWLKRS